MRVRIAAGVIITDPARGMPGLQVPFDVSLRLWLFHRVPGTVFCHDEGGFSLFSQVSPRFTCSPMFFSVFLLFHFVLQRRHVFLVSL